jgi:quercetin dioxygenase-like cupin family protein
MQLDGEQFPVEAGDAVNIPPDAIHSVSNASASVHPLIWVSIGLAEPAADD